MKQHKIIWLGFHKSNPGAFAGIFNSPRRETISYSSKAFIEKSAYDELYKEYKLILRKLGESK